MAPTVMCCCVFRLRRACVLIGAILTALHAVALLALAGGALFFYLCDCRGSLQNRLLPTERNYRARLLAVAAGVTLLYLVCNVLLLVGARRDRPRLLLAWLVFGGLAFSGHTVGLFMGFIIAVNAHFWGLLATVLTLIPVQALLWHWFLVVRAQYLQLRLKAPRHDGPDIGSGQRNQDTAVTAAAENAA